MSSTPKPPLRRMPCQASCDHSCVVACQRFDKDWTIKQIKLRLKISTAPSRIGAVQGITAYCQSSTCGLKSPRNQKRCQYAASKRSTRNASGQSQLRQRRCCMPCPSVVSAESNSSLCKLISRCRSRALKNGFAVACCNSTLRNCAASARVGSFSAPASRRAAQCSTAGVCLCLFQNMDHLSSNCLMQRGKVLCQPL